MQPSRLLALLLFPAVLFMTGCVPTGIAWLPDSNGFVYVEPNPDYGPRRLVYFDVKKAEQRVLVSGDDIEGLLPAVSPDGKQIALPRHTKNNALRIVFYDRDGKEIDRTAPLPWGNKATVDGDMLSWSADGKHILVSHDCVSYPPDARPPNHDKPKTGIYDLDSKKLTVLDGTPPIFGATPIRPDGKGFLLVTGYRDEQHVAFVDWTGKSLWESKNGDDTKDSIYAPLCISHWDGHDAVLRLLPPEDQAADKGLLLRIDTEKGRAAKKSIPAEELQVDGRSIQHQYVFPATGACLRILIWTEKGEPRYRVEVVKPDEKKAAVLVEKTKSHPFIFPSPNAKLAAVSFDDHKSNNFLVVNSDGKLVAECPKEAVPKR